MPIDTDRLIQIAGELKDMEQRRERLLTELQLISQGEARSVNSTKVASVQVRSPSPTKPPVMRRRRQRKAGLSVAIVDLLKSSGGAHTAGDIVTRLNLPNTKGQTASVSTSLVRLAKEGRLKKDKVRGYRAA